MSAVPEPAVLAVMSCLAIVAIWAADPVFAVALAAVTMMRSDGMQRGRP
jgi:hypothetical protein